MSEEGGGRASHSGIIAMFYPKPTLKPVLYWQGIVEIIARGVLIVSRLLIVIENEKQKY